MNQSQDLFLDISVNFSLYVLSYRWDIEDFTLQHLNSARTQGPLAACFHIVMFTFEMPQADITYCMIGTHLTADGGYVE